MSNEGSSISSLSLSSPSSSVLPSLVVDLRRQLHSGRLSGGFRWTTYDAAGQLQAKRKKENESLKIGNQFWLENSQGG